MKAKNQTKLPVLKNALVRQHRIKTVSESRGVHLRQPLQSKLFTFQVPPEHFFFPSLQTSVDSVSIRVHGLLARKQTLFGA